MTPKSEFSRHIAVNRIGSNGLKITVEATADECRLIARRLNLPDVTMLRCRYNLVSSDQNSVVAQGALAAKFQHVCVVTLEPFEDVLTASFNIKFVPEEFFTESSALELDVEDEIPYTGNNIDLGEATIEQFALELPAYPHKPDSVLPEEIIPEEEVQAASVSEKRINPFAALQELRQKKK